MPHQSTLAVVATGPDRPNVSERTYQNLRSRILEGGLPPGTVLTERRMAGLLGVSRTPLRGALSRLEGEGLVERLANGAVVIRRFSIDDLLQILTVRRALEAEAAALATGRASPAVLGALAEEARVFAAGTCADFERFWRHDDHFHDVVAEAAGQPLLEGMIADLRRKGRMCHAPRMPASFVEQGREHLAVLEALAGSDPDLSRRRMQAHLDAVRGRLVAWLTRTVPA
ncbi:MAG: GntR family transcriptional regulator [Pseudomonadota bacterium]